MSSTRPVRSRRSTCRPLCRLIRFSREHFPEIPQVACFDTGFHAGMPSIARTLPIPHALRAEGVERYGFHGLSCESIVRQLGAALPSNLLIAHLGNGASITAVKHGKSIDTSMGLTPDRRNHHGDAQRGP